MSDVAIAVRDERPEDLAAIRAVNDAAFDQPLEGRIVDALRAHGAVRLSLVAEVDGRVVGHILFSPVTSAGAEGLGLGPMAVTPDQQRRGIGGALIEAGLARLRAAGCPFVVVLGHHEVLHALRLRSGQPLRAPLRVGRARRSLHGARHRSGRHRRRGRADQLPARVPDGNARLSPIGQPGPILEVTPRVLSRAHVRLIWHVVLRRRWHPTGTDHRRAAGRDSPRIP